jgi:hypothetical protein
MPSVNDAADELRRDYVRLDGIERTVLMDLIDCALEGPVRFPAATRNVALELRERIRPKAERDISRPQELAADAMQAKHGRSAVRHQADGSVVIVGLLDDIERETVCIERDGRERWRR